MTIIVDSDGLIGISNKEDAHYAKANILLERLQKSNAEFIYPSTTIAETTAILQIRLNKQNTANQILEFVRSGVFTIQPIDQMILTAAISYLKKDRSKHATLFDGVVAAVAKKHNADAIFSFDRFYRAQGFILASELF